MTSSILSEEEFIIFLARWWWEPIQETSNMLSFAVNFFNMSF